MKDISKLKLNEESTIKESLKIIDEGAMHIGLVVDKDNKLLGTLSDGDIRRGLLSGLKLDDTIKDIIFRAPTVCNLEDTKERLLEIAIEKKIYQFPIIDDHGRLIGIEEVDTLIRPNQKGNCIVLMVGGLGTRLRPLTENVPKPMLKVGGKPILETIIMNFKKYGFTNIILSVSYKSEIIEDYFKDGSKFGVKIQYIHEKKRMGTAGALSLMNSLLNEPFFVMNGDLLTNINFEHMLEYHLQQKSKATMGVREYDIQVPYGVVNVKNENIISIDEKPIHSFFVSGGIYILDPEVLSFIPSNEFFDMPTLFESIIKNQFKTVSFPIREYWMDIGRMEEFEKANDEYHKVF